MIPASPSGPVHGGDALAEALRRELERVRALASRDRGILAAILRYSPHGIIVADPKGRPVLFNTAAERIWAGSASASHVADWSRYRAFHPDGSPYSGDDWSMARALRSGETVQAEEVEIERFDGTRGVLLGSTAPILRADGEIDGAISVFADITLFKDRERALLGRERGIAGRLARLHAFTAALSEAADLADVARATVEHGRAALHAASGGVWVASPDGFAELLHGVPGGPFEADRRVPASTDGPVARALAAGEATWAGAPADVEQAWPDHARRAEGRTRALACVPLEFRSARIGALAFGFEAQRDFDPEERALVLAVARQAAQALERARLFDAERRAREDAEAAQRRMAFLSESSALLASSLDYEDTLASVARLAVPRVADCCAVSLVDAFAGAPVALAHVDPGKLPLARELGRAIPADPDAARGVAAVLRTGRSELYADLASDPDPLAFPPGLGVRSAMIVPMTARGRTLGAITLVSAESGRRYGPSDVEMAQHLARRAALAIDNARLYADAQRAIRARDDVLAILAHDLRNPLHALGLASSLISSPGSPPERVRSHAAAIERSARRMGRLVRDLLDSSRIESGRLSLERRPAQAGALLAAARSAVGAAAAEKGVSVEVAPGAEALRVECDRDRTVQVLTNLLENGLAATPRGGRIVLSAATDGAEVRFSVADTGSGIPPEHHRRIFDRYWTSRESRAGTGLGLAIAKGIVDAHGGRIWVESRVGAGATFHFTLPSEQRRP